MAFVIPDIDNYIVILADLPSLNNLRFVNKYFYDLVSKKPIIKQYEIIDQMKIKSVNDIFTTSCEKGFLDYAIYLVDNYDIDIIMNISDAFIKSCQYGHIDIAKWLVKLEESGDYDRNYVHAIAEYAFIKSCYYGHLNIAKWLVELRESDSGTKFDINVGIDHAFINSCICGNSDIAKWLVELCKSGSYTKIDIHASTE